MTVAKQIEIRDHIREYFDLAAGGEAVFVPRKENRNVYVISQQEYEDLQKARRNAAYLSTLDHSFSQLSAGETVHFSLEELRSLEG